MGASYLRYAMAMRDRLPLVGKVFESGDIDYRSFQTIVFRTDLIADADVLAKVDAQVAALVSRRPSLTRGGLGAAVDQIVTKVDHDAVRQAHTGGLGPVRRRHWEWFGNGLGGGQCGCHRWASP